MNRVVAFAERRRAAISVRAIIPRIGADHAAKQLAETGRSMVPGAGDRRACRFVADARLDPRLGTGCAAGGAIHAKR
jgi:hypothetical protein